MPPHRFALVVGQQMKRGCRLILIRCAEGLELRFTPSEEHQAFPGMVNGGIIGSLLDCHGNWAAAIALMDKSGLEEPPCTVTAKYSVSLRRPTPSGVELHVLAEVEELMEDRAKIKMTLTSRRQSMCYW